MMSTDNESPRILRVAETASTNSLLRELVIKESLAEGSVVVADFQTAGRGQIGNTWESEAGKNLMFSLVLYPTCIPANRQFLISQIAALSVKEALDLYADHITVKWPNDIYWKDKKICGMLIENDLSGHNLYCSIIGIGINLNQTVFRGDAPNPVSLFQIIGKERDVSIPVRVLLSQTGKRSFQRRLDLVHEIQRFKGCPNNLVFQSLIHVQDQKRGIGLNIKHLCQFRTILIGPRVIFHTHETFVHERS